MQLSDATYQVKYIGFNVLSEAYPKDFVVTDYEKKKILASVSLEQPYCPYIRWDIPHDKQKRLLEIIHAFAYTEVDKREYMKDKEYRAKVEPNVSIEDLKASLAELKTAILTNREIR